MASVKKYRLGNEEYELKDQYLGWVPAGFDTWQDFHQYCFLEGKPAAITLVSPDGQNVVHLNLHQQLIKDAFPLEFYGEERAEDWSKFFMVSNEAGPDVKFVIPAH